MRPSSLSNIPQPVGDDRMTTLNHQYLAKWFFSDEKIQEIMDSNKVSTLGNSNPLLVNAFRFTNMNKMELIEISGKGFKGYLLTVSNPSMSKWLPPLISESGERGPKKLPRIMER
jgi:exopolysaccharide biosynthesis protein